MNQMLLIDTCGNIEIDLKESNIEKGLVRFRGKFQESEIKNKNNRIYKHSVLAENVERLQDIIKHRGLVGELDHPETSIVHFKEASHVITRLWWEGNILMGEGEILSTAHGKQLKALLNDGVRIGMSSRGVGSGKDENGVLIIGENYKLITFDAVADPSTPMAFQERVVDKQENYIPNKNIIKNESNSIYIRKEAVLAALGGIIKEQTYKVRSM